MTALRSVPSSHPSDVNVTLFRLVHHLRLTVALAAQLYPSFTSYEVSPRLLQPYSSLPEMLADIRGLDATPEVDDNASSLRSIALRIIHTTQAISSIAQATCSSEHNAAWHLLEDFGSTVRRAKWLLAPRSSCNGNDAPQLYVLRDRPARAVRVLIVDGDSKGDESDVANTLRAVGLKLEITALDDVTSLDDNVTLTRRYDLLLWNHDEETDLYVIFDACKMPNVTLKQERSRVFA